MYDLGLFVNTQISGEDDGFHDEQSDAEYREKMLARKLSISQFPILEEPWIARSRYLDQFSVLTGALIRNIKPDYKPELHIVHNSLVDAAGPDYFLYLNGEQFLMSKNSAAFPLTSADVADDFKTRKFVRFSTSLAERWGKILWNEGLEDFLKIENQFTTEVPFVLEYTNQNSFQGRPLVVPHSEKVLEGPQAEYFREVFFHIPYLIAKHLNAEGKYKEADWWYRKIFDPTAAWDSSLSNPTDRYWRYTEFRNLSLPQLQDLLNDPVAIAKYKSNPFDSHAIARLRLSAYMKAIVMSYVDNLIDHGDSHFTKFTWEENTKALMLYQMAKDILGERPRVLGKCDTAEGGDVTYQDILDFGTQAEFLIYVENWVPYAPDSVEVSDISVEADFDDNNGSSSFRQRGVGTPSMEMETNFGVPFHQHSLLLQSGLMQQEGNKLVFCVPTTTKCWNTGTGWKTACSSCGTAWI